MKVASNAKFLGAFIFCPSSCGGSVAVSLTVSKSEITRNFTFTQICLNYSLAICHILTDQMFLCAGFPLLCTHKIPRFFQDFIQNSRYNFLFFNVASTYNWVSVYTLYITSTLFCLHYPKVCIPPLTATHNDLYHFERWVLIKKQKLMT